MKDLGVVLWTTVQKSPNIEAQSLISKGLDSFLGHLMLALLSCQRYETMTLPLNGKVGHLSRTDESIRPVHSQLTTCLVRQDLVQ